jgi:glycosyltransferase involved in cell wall biosynthesis
MKVLFFQLFPPTIWARGGGETYLERVRCELTEAGVEVEFLNLESPQREFDVLHIFGSSHDVSDLVVTVAAMGKPVVVSPICLSNKPMAVWKAARLIDRIVPFPTLYSYRRKIYEHAVRLFPSSMIMATQLHQYFGAPFSKLKVVHLGADEAIARANAADFVRVHGMEDFVLEVGRVNSRKGQSRLIRALQGTGATVVFIGPLDPSDPQGCREFLQLIESNQTQCRYLGPIYDRSILYGAFHAAKVHALPSVGEFPGLVNLEAALGGANIVTGAAPEVREYLGDAVRYCDPTSVPDIRTQVLAALESPRQESLGPFVLDRFTWRRTAQILATEYELAMRAV